MYYHYVVLSFLLGGVKPLTELGLLLLLQLIVADFLQVHGLLLLKQLCNLH